MATYYSPNIITNGLTAYIDAGNSKCYPRTGATVTDLTGTVGNFSGNANYINSNVGFYSGASWTSGTTSILNTDVHSIFFKIKFNPNATYTNGTTGNWEKIFTYAPAGTDRSPGIWRYPSNRWIHWRYDPINSGTDFGKNGTSLDTGNEFNLNTWYYIGLTKDGASTVVYVNGVRVGTGSVANPKTSGNAAIVLFESYTTGLCNINQIKIYNRVLSDAEVLTNFNVIRARSISGVSWGCQPYGTSLYSYCSGNALYGVYQDGNCGQYTELITECFAGCGCTTPP